MCDLIMISCKFDSSFVPSFKGLSHFPKLPIKAFKAVKALDLVSNDGRGELSKEPVIFYVFKNIWMSIRMMILRMLAWTHIITQHLTTRNIRKQKIIFSCINKASKIRHILWRFIWIEHFYLLALVISVRIVLHVGLILFVSFVLIEILMILRIASKIFICLTQSPKLLTNLWWVVFLFWTSITPFQLLLLSFDKPSFLRVFFPWTRYLNQQSRPLLLVLCCTSLDHIWCRMSNI